MVQTPRPWTLHCGFWSLWHFPRSEGLLPKGPGPFLGPEALSWDEAPGRCGASSVLPIGTRKCSIWHPCAGEFSRLYHLWELQGLPERLMGRHPGWLLREGDLLRRMPSGLVRRRLHAWVALPRLPLCAHCVCCAACNTLRFILLGSELWESCGQRAF